MQGWKLPCPQGRAVGGNAKASSIVGVPGPTHNGAAARSTSSEGGVLNSAHRSAQSARPLHSLSSGSPSSKHSPITKSPTKRASARRNAVSRAHGTSVIFSLSPERTVGRFESPEVGWALLPPGGTAGTLPLWLESLHAPKHRVDGQLHRTLRFVAHKNNGRTAGRPPPIDCGGCSVKRPSFRKSCGLPPSGPGS